MAKVTVKYTTYLKEMPEDTKGLNIEETGKKDAPFKVDSEVVIDMDNYLEDKDLTELATRAAVIDIQRDGRAGIKSTLGLTTSRESGATVRAGQLERLQALKGSIPNDQYENMKKLIMGS